MRVWQGERESKEARWEDQLRIYHAVPGKIENLVARFRDHTMKLFADHGIKSVAYWTALDEPVKSSTFFYILEHPSREAAAANWKVFQDDPEWKRVKAKSEENGKLVEKIDSTFLTLTDFSPRLGGLRFHRTLPPGTISERMRGLLP